MDATVLLTGPLQWLELRLRARDWFGYVNDGDGDGDGDGGGGGGGDGGDGGGGGGIGGVAGGGGDRRNLVTPEIFVFGSRPHGYCVTAWWRALREGVPNVRVWVSTATA